MILLRVLLFIQYYSTEVTQHYSKVFTRLYPNTPKAGEHKHESVGEFNIYFLETQFDSGLLTC